jgi:glucose/arabinose dehydrogenase
VRWRRPRAVVLATALHLTAGVGCGSAAEPDPAPEAAAPDTETATARTPTQAGAPAFRLTRIASGLGDALHITGIPGQPSRLAVVQQSGRIRILERGRLRRGAFLDVSRLISAGGEQGLLGLAFHPDYASNGRFYVNYTNRSGDTRVVEYRRRSTFLADAGSARRLLSIDQPFGNHNGGHLAFGPDGYLYIATGDGGGGGDPQGNGQRLDTLLGKILRIDVDSRSGGRPYGIPADNPFTGAGRRAEIYSYGLRNPWRFSFDRQRGDIWIGDVGAGALEEIDFRPRDGARGVNFGWSAYEGRSAFGGSVRGSRPVFPVAQYSHGRGCSVTGGYVYRGSRVPALRGRYLFADYCTGRLWSMRAGPNPGGLREHTGRVGVSLGLVTSFGEGLNGDVYVVAGGSIHRVSPR